MEILNTYFKGSYFLFPFPEWIFIQCRTEELETVIEQDKAKAVQVELLKKENGKLISQLTAQESVIDGLKMERKIWGQELAQQGKTFFIIIIHSIAIKMLVFSIILFK